MSDQTPQPQQPTAQPSPPKEPQPQPIKPPTGNEVINEAPLKTPEDFFNLDDLPKDLKWIITHFNLPPHDPLVVMFAWHSKRIQNCRDVIEDMTFKLSASLDSRVGKIEAEVESMDRLADTVHLLNNALSEKPLEMAKKLELELQGPIDVATQSCDELSTKLTTTVQQTTETLKTTSRERLFMHLGIGFTVGCVFTSWIFCIFFS